MPNIEAIKENLLKKTKFLVEKGYKKVLQKVESWITTVSFIKPDSPFAIEFELDFRDMDVFVLITVLENQKLPKGYYVLDGKMVRSHLEKLYEKGKLKTGDWKSVIQLRKSMKQRSELRIEKMIDAYCELLKLVTGEIQTLSTGDFS